MIQFKFDSLQCSFHAFSFKLSPYHFHTSLLSTAYCWLYCLLKLLDSSGFYPPIGKKVYGFSYSPIPPHRLSPDIIKKKSHETFTSISVCGAHTEATATILCKVTIWGRKWPKLLQRLSIPHTHSLTHVLHDTPHRPASQANPRCSFCRRKIEDSRLLAS